MYRSTKISLFLNKCPHAVTLYERDEDWDRTRYAVGVAAHDFLHALGKFPNSNRDEVARHVFDALITTGRTGHDAEGPLPPNAVAQGRDLVFEWLDWGGNPWFHEGSYEVGLGFTRRWEPTDYGPGAWFGIHPDVVYPVRESHDGMVMHGLVTRDYKTSWNAAQHTCESIQLRAQAVAVALSWRRLVNRQPDFVRREVVNLRTRQEYSVDTWLTPEGQLQLDTWRGDIDSICRALEEGERSPRVGQHCISCQFQASCDAWNRTNPSLASKDADAVLVDDYILSKANTARLEAAVRELVEDGAHVLENGDRVGYVARPRTVVVLEAPALLQAYWNRSEPSKDESYIRGLLKAADLGVAQVKAIAKAIYPKRTDVAERRALVDKCTTTKLAPRFGVWEK